MTGHLSNMIEALRLEVAKIKERGGSTQIELRGGQKIGTAENRYLYCFQLQEELKYLRDDTPVRVVCDRSEVEGTIVSVSKGSLTVALDDDLGPKIALARLIADDSFLIEKLREKLEEIEKRTVHFNDQLAASVIGAAAPLSGFKEPAPQVLTNTDLNQDQKNAVRLAFGSNTSFIWGPPGTGKTKTLAHVVESYYRAGHSVLIVSNTNIAVDTALQRIAQRLEAEPEFYEGAVLRHGPLGKELEERYGEYVNIDRIIERLGKELEVQRKSLQSELLKKDEEAGPFRRALQHLQELKHLKSELQQGERLLRSKESHCQDLQTKLRAGRIKLNKLQIDLDRSRELGSIRRFLAGLNPQRLENDINAVTRANTNLDSALIAASKQLTEQKIKLEQLRKDLVGTKAAVPNNYSEAQVTSLLATIDTSIAQLQAKLRSIEDQLVALRQEVLNNCRILATTVYRTYLKGQVVRSFDVVIVDEASMLMLPMTFFAAGLAGQAVVVAGDFRQLAPIVTSDDPLAVEWLKKDTFQKTNISQEVNKQALTHLAVLGVQYRMDPEICDCVNALFYSDYPLKAGEGAGQGAKHFPFGEGKLVFVDTSPLNPWSYYKLGTYSRYNLLHALLIRKLAAALDENLIGPPGACKLGIISPFSAQTNLLQALLNDGVRTGSELAATVHRFQGNERDSIIIDLTDSIGTPISRFMKAICNDEDGARLLNVAISRARHRIILLANLSFLRDKAPTDGKLRRLLDYFEEHGTSINAIDILNLQHDDWSKGISHLGHTDGVDLSDADVQFLTEGSFYPRFTADLKHAKNSILIFSPFLTERGTSRWIDLLRFAISRGVRVRLVTRPPGDQGGVLENGLSETVSAIRELGIPVDYRARIHEKIAIIDEEILWHGSLNILSHRDTTESMLRVESPAACARLGTYVTTPTARKQQTSIYEAENPDCPDCGEPTTWKNGRFGVYFECDDCGTKIDLRRPMQSKYAARRSAVGGRENSSSSHDDSTRCRRVGCGGRLVRKTGRRGAFLGCTNYRSKNCRETQDIR